MLSLMISHQKSSAPMVSDPTITTPGDRGSALEASGLPTRRSHGPARTRSLRGSPGGSGCSQRQVRASGELLRWVTVSTPRTSCLSSLAVDSASTGGICGERGPVPMCRRARARQAPTMRCDTTGLASDSFVCDHYTPTCCLLERHCRGNARLNKPPAATGRNGMSP